MKKRGPQVYRDVQQSVTDAEAEATRLERRLAVEHTELARLRAAETRTLARLARVRLDELAAKRVAHDLDEADREALAHLDRHAEGLQRIVAEIDASWARQASLEEEHAELVAARDAAHAEHDAAFERVMQQLAEDDDYVDRAASVEQATEIASHAAEKAKTAESDRDEKRKPYEADKLFHYLWERRYLFPEYEAIAPIRALDGWVAGLCAYHRAHRDFGMLLEIPRRLRAHAIELAERADAEASNLQELERAALRSAGVDALAEARRLAQERVDRVVATIEDIERQHAELERERAAYSMGSDRHTQHALTTLAEQFERDSIRELWSDATRTSTAEDDEVVRELEQVREDLEAVTARAREVEEAHARATAAVADLRELRRRFRKQDFDSDESGFDEGFDFGKLANRILTGTVVLDEAWGRIKRRQRFRRRHHSDGTAAAFHVLGSILSSMGSSSGSRSSGGFGGFGGGGFRTGGGFGGGGGFRTGGGF